MPMKPKVSRKGDPNKSNVFDQCQTPAYAVDPLAPYIRPDWVVWEPARGEGRLARALSGLCARVVETDILNGENFFTVAPPQFDCIVTNPPYSIKFDWLERCYDLGKPFALLVPLETLGANRAQSMFERHGVELLLLNKRVNFKMPNIGERKSAAQFPVAWFTWGMSLGAPLVYGKIERRHENQIRLLDA